MSELMILLALLTQEAAKSESRRLAIDLPAERTLVIAGASVSWKDLAATIRRHADAGIRQIVLRADGSVPFSSIQNLMAAAREAGIEGVQFSSEKPATPVTFAGEPRKSLRIKVKEGGRGLEIVVLEESTVASIGELRKQLKTVEEMPVVIDAGYEVPYDAVRQIAGACTAEGFDKISFAGAVRKSGAVRVLYAEQEPRAEFRYLRNMLDRSKDFHLAVYLDTADPELPDSLRTFPKDLSSYDVVLMGGLRELDDERRKALAEFVTRGGGIVWMAPGQRPSEWLGDALPSICPVKLRSHPQALKHPGSLVVRDPEDSLTAGFKWDEIAPKCRAEWAVGELAEGARILVESPRKDGPPGAILVSQPIQKGRGVFVGVPNTWEWREGTGDQPYFARFWANVLKWAAGR